MGTDYQGTKKRSSSLNEWQVKGVEYFLPCPSAPLLLCIPVSYLLLPSSTFPVSPFVLILVSSVAIFPFLSAFVRLSSRRSLREPCGELSLFYTSTIKKQGKGFDMKPKKCSWTEICADVSKT